MEETLTVVIMVCGVHLPGTFTTPFKTTATVLLSQEAIHITVLMSVQEAAVQDDQEEEEAVVVVLEEAVVHLAILAHQNITLTLARVPAPKLLLITTLLPVQDNSSKNCYCVKGTTNKQLQLLQNMSTECLTIQAAGQTY